MFVKVEQTTVADDMVHVYKIILTDMFLLLLSFSAGTNSSGKLPEDWEDDIESMLIRTAYLVFTHKIPPEFLVNMDETPLMLIARRNYTWADEGVSNVACSGSKDKRQSTATPWLTYTGEIIFFHSTMKGTTERCLPSKDFRDKDVFKAPNVPVYFGYTDNHWVSKDTMRDQVKRSVTSLMCCVECRMLYTSCKYIAPSSSLSLSHPLCLSLFI